MLMPACAQAWRSLPDRPECFARAIVQKKRSRGYVGRAALKLPFERVVLVGRVVGDNPVVTDEGDEIVDDVLEVRLLL